MNNFFSGSGKIVTGNAYIARENAEKELRNRTLCNSTYGSVSVIGMQRMGKSSLVYNVYSVNTEEYYERDIIIVSLPMSVYQTPDKFFKAIVESVHEMLKDHDDDDTKSEKKASKVQASFLEDGGFKEIQGYFRYIRKLGKRVVCIIDEFDHSKDLFASFPEGFSILRELAYQPETDVTFVFVSRRLVTELEMSLGISTLANILGNPVYIKAFNDVEMEQYHQRSGTYGIVPSEEDKKRFNAAIGNHPYWSDLMMCQYCNEWNFSPETSLQSILDRDSGVLFAEFDRLFSLLEEQGLLSKLFQIAVGPAFDYTKADVQKLLDYGIIVLSDGEATVTSEKLFEYMQARENSLDFYPLWNTTEKNLRNLMKSKLQEKYGDNWESKVIAAHLKEEEQHPMSLSAYLRKAIALQNKYKNNPDLYIQEKAYTVVDALTTSGLFELYKREYPLFQTLFQKEAKIDKASFINIANHISRARNPYQHNNDELIQPNFKNLTRDYCEMFNRVIEESGIYEQSSQSE